MDSATCGVMRDLISARADGELAPELEPLVEGHVAQCPACADFAEGAHQVRRLAGLHVQPPAAPVEPVVQAVSVPDVGKGAWVRIGLGAVGLTLLLRGLILIFTGDLDGASDHVARHLGAFGAALAIGLVYAAWRPERALGLMPLAGVLGVLLAATAVIDVATRRSDALSEATHLVEVIGIVLLWILSGGRYRVGRWWDRVRARSSGPDLRAVEEAPVTES
jgi:predicted anti-sigma-YlaC factor YlaD